MTKVKLFLIIVLSIVLIYGCNPNTDETVEENGNTEIGSNENQGNTSDSIIIDHNHIDISNIPEEWIDKAKENFRIGYSHTSHGSQIVTGISALSSNSGNSVTDNTKAYSIIEFTYSDWGFATGVFFADYWANNYASDLGHNGDLSWRDATVTMLDMSNNDRNVVMWSWCGGVSDNDNSGINTYLNAMNQLEIDYPDVKFIYMTGHLDGSGTDGNLHVRNEQIRKYCIDNGKILFDFADIESYDPDGNYFLDRGADDGCYYNGGNWADQWISSNGGNDLANLARNNNCGECAHSHRLNCVMKGRAFWWLMARISGWDGS